MYTRVFSAILDSSIWQEDLPVRVLWLTMLIIADENRDGTVNVPIRRLAQKAALSEEQTRTAIDTLMAPDPDSDSPEEEGRRIVPLIPDRPSRGWRLVNWKKYKDIATAENRRAQVAENMRRHRAKGGNKGESDQTLSPGDQRVIPSTTTTTSNTTSTAENLKSKSLLSSVEPPTPQTFKIGQPEYDLAALLLERIRHRNPEHRQPDLQKWARDVDLMHRLENRSFAVIREVIEWCQADTTPAPGQTFCWANNILSTGKLRKQFDQLLLKSGQMATGGNGAKEQQDHPAELSLRDRLLQHKPTVDVILETFGDPERSRSALDAFCENAHFISGPPLERWAKWKALSEQEGI